MSDIETEFVAVAAHELRTPLTSIATFTEMLGSEGQLSGEHLATAVAAIARNTDRMLALVEDLIVLARLESGQMTLSPVPLDVAALLTEAAGVIDECMPQLGVRLDVPSGPPLRGDQRLLRQLMRIVLGAVASQADTGPVRVTGTVDRSMWTIEASADAENPLTDGHMMVTPATLIPSGPPRRSLALSILLARAITSRHGGMLSTRRGSGSTAIVARLPVAG